MVMMAMIKSKSAMGDDYVVPGNGIDEIDTGNGNDVIYLQDEMMWT